MKTGFPRPQTRVDKLNGTWLHRVNPTTAKKIRDAWKSKMLPHPYSAKSDHIAEVNGGRVLQCVYFKRCIVCGTQVRGEKVWIYRSQQTLDMYSDSGPFHEKCMKLTIALCPRMSEVAQANSKTRFEWVEVYWSAVQPYILDQAKRENYKSGVREIENPFHILREQNA